MHLCAPYGAHLMQYYGNTEPRTLPSGFAARETAADDVDWI